MFRADILTFIPAVLIALTEVILWSKRKNNESKENIELDGNYKELDRLRFTYYIYVAYLIFFFQLIYDILPITHHFSLITFFKIIGYLCIGVGTIVAISSLYTLGTNWNGMQYYQIKKGQKLVTKGFYKYLRHPIYTGALYQIIGYELLTVSWLIIPIVLISFYIAYKHSLLEEKLLTQKFGKDYIYYKRKSKMFIPGIL
jgi:protein-S-isoprenylcysteine O-methyltransferase Ste14